MKKTISYIHSVAEIGGAERMTEALFHGINKDQFNPMLICPETGPFTDHIASLGYTTDTTDFFQPSWKHPIQSLIAKKKWKEVLLKHQTYVVHTGDLDCARSALLATHSLNIPVICHVHFPFGEGYAKWIFRNLPKPAGFLFCSQELQDDVGPMLNKTYPESKQWVVHNGVDIHTFQPHTPNNAIPKIGIIANLQKRKGHEDFLNMADILLKQGKRAQFEIIGGDILKEPRQAHLEAFSRSLDIHENVTFHGQVSNVKELLAELDIFVCASHQEAFPVSILEAMAAGKPVVSTNVNGIPEAIVQDETGLMVPPHNPEALAKAVGFLLDNPEKIKEMGDKGRQRVVDHFSREVYAKNIEDIYLNYL